MNIERLESKRAIVGEGFEIRRALPNRHRRTIGAWCFLDHAGPADYPAGQGLVIGPHPHIGLQTFSWMIEGTILHTDSLGYRQWIRPGQVNLMTAGRGISHAEESPSDAPGRFQLAQLWIDTESLKYTGARAVTRLLKGELPGPEASTGKMMWVETHQRLQELAMEIQGPYSQLARGSAAAVDGGVWQYSFLRSRANSIEGGTTEIQKNIIGERVLGLPKG